MWVSSWATGQAARLVLVLAAGIAVRVALVPLTRGQDFEVWDLASAATLQGIDIYAHHPAYPGGPYAYFPLFLYLELPFQWLAEHTGISFTVLGKVPILAGDVACALVLAAELRDRTASNRAVLLGTSLFFLNPLVLYNGAFYGRFDTVALALLLLAVRLLRKSKRSAGMWYGLAIAAKTFPAFVLPGIVRNARGRRLWLVITLMTVLLVLSAPYIPSWRAMLSDIVVYDAVKAPGALSWQTLFIATTSIETLRLVSYVLLAFYLVGAVLLARVLELDLYILATLVLFLVCSKVVLEQYLLWPMPWLVLVLWTAPRIRAATIAFFVAVTVVGMVANPHIQPWGRSPALIAAGFALMCVIYLVALVVEGRRRDDAQTHQPNGSKSRSNGAATVPSEASQRARQS
jgi:Glycosyltransferase family 87